MRSRCSAARWSWMLLLVCGGCFELPWPDDDEPRQVRRQPQREPEAMSLLGRPLYADPPDADLERLEADLASARQQLAESPDDPQRIIWVGRRLGYLSRMKEAIALYTEGIEPFPEFAALYRHRGHRYISVRRFDAAILDLERAAKLLEGAPPEIEMDGIPNARGVPLTTTQFNVWYHLALARYLKGDFAGALPAWDKAAEHSRGLDDNIVAVTHWKYMTLRRMNQPDEAAKVLAPITPDMDVIENQAYHRLTLMYKGLLDPKRVQEQVASGVDDATTAYGVGNWHLYNNRPDEAVQIFRRAVGGSSWSAFGFIAAEADLARMRAR